ncbi:MAG TPA: multicopper oxidase domain-containing protein [Candidatus Polarisedimenticolia bacterium]|nr:multicopper oxidase domain-containing protein [Candidatus Polarisedimenticolia bacterium]
MGTYVWQRRGRFTLVAAGIVVVLLLLVGIRLIGPAMATSGGDPYSVPLATDTNPAADIFETTIIADEATVDIGNGVMAHALTYNGTLPGPEFRLKPNDTVIVHFENHLETPTGIHWHGIELSNASDGTPLTQNQVPPGGKFLYKFKVTRPGIFWYHPHHHSSTNQVFKGLYGPIIITDPNEPALISGGVIPGASQTLTLALSDVTVCKAQGSNDTATYDGNTQPHVALAPGWAQPSPTPKDLCETSPIDEEGNPRAAFDEGDIPNIQTSAPTGKPTNEGQTVLTNGKNVGGRAGNPGAPGALDAGAATFDVQAGQGLRLQIGNTATIRFFRLRLTGTVGGVDGTQIPLIRIGGEGGLLDNAVEQGGVIPPGPSPPGFDFKYDLGEILLDPGSRADVVVAIPPTATGDLTLWTEDFFRTGGAGWAKLPTVPVMHLHVTGVAGSTYTISDGTALRASTGDTVPALGAATGTLLDPSLFVPPKEGLASQDIQLTNSATGGFGVDTVIGSHDFSGDYTVAPRPCMTVAPFTCTARYAKLNDILELTVTNKTGAHHPFHLHGFSIQPLDLTKAGSPTYTWPYHEFRDNVDVPGGYTLRFRVKLDDRPLMDGTTMGGGLGRWVFHCHIFFHATFGMISEFDVVDATGNERPYVNADAAEVAVDEGQTATMSGTYTDPDGDVVTLTGPAIGTFTDNGDGTWDWSYTTTDGPDESQILYVTADDGLGHKDQVSFQLTVNNVPPTLTLITPPTPLTGALYALGSANIEVKASITDPGTADVLSCSFNWDDGTSTVNAPAGGFCDALHSFTQAGVYTVVLTGSDDDGGSDSESILIVVYDPTAGFVTGGGWIDSPPGAYVADPLLEGKAIFGFESKYKKGATVPIGHTEFKFQVADFRFESDSYQWLVVAGAKAQYKGVGTVNGAGNFGFLLTATDGQISGGGGIDKFRIKIWDKSAGDAVVYDNVLGASEDIDVANPQAIAQGSIVIHKPK